MARPPIGRPVEVRLPPETLAEVDARAAAAGHTRAVALRHAVEAWLAQGAPATSQQRGCTGRFEVTDAEVSDQLALMLTDAQAEARKYRHAMLAEKGEVIARQRRIEHLEGQLAQAQAELEANTKSERGADHAEVLALLRATIPHLPNNKLRRQVQDVVNA